MNIKKIAPIKENEKGVTYELEDFKLMFRKAGFKGGMHEHDTFEELIFIQGEAKIKIGDEVKEFFAPFIVRFPPKAYHEILYKTDCIFLEKRVKK